MNCGEALRLRCRHSWSTIFPIEYQRAALRRCNALVHVAQVESEAACGAHLSHLIILVVGHDRPHVPWRLIGDGLQVEVAKQNASGRVCGVGIKCNKWRFKVRPFHFRFSRRNPCSPPFVYPCWLTTLLFWNRTAA